MGIEKLDFKIIDLLAHDMDIDDERSIFYLSEKAIDGMQQLYEV